MLHVDSRGDAYQPSTSQTTSRTSSQVTSNAAVKLKSCSLLLTCCVLVTAPDGSAVEARAILDNASSLSFVSECLAQSLSLPRTSRSIRISGIAGLSPKSPLHSVVNIQISSTSRTGRMINLSAIVLPKV